MTPNDADDLRSVVREHCAQAAREAGNASCCGDPGNDMEREEQAMSMHE